MSWFRKERPSMSRDTSMKGIPFFREGVRVEINGQGEPVLLVERKNLLIGKLAPRQVILDDLGLAVTKLIQQKKSVKNIILDFSKEFKLHRRESEAGIVAFLNALMKRNAISVMIK